MRQVAEEYQKHIAAINKEMSDRYTPSMTDAETMHQIGLSMRAVYDELPEEQQTEAMREIFQDCATEAAVHAMGVGRVMAVVHRVVGSTRERTVAREAATLAALHAVGGIH